MCNQAFETGEYADEGVEVWCELPVSHDGPHVGELTDGLRTARVEWPSVQATAPHR